MDAGPGGEESLSLGGRSVCATFPFCVRSERRDEARAQRREDGTHKGGLFVPRRNPAEKGLASGRAGQRNEGTKWTRERKGKVSSSR